MCNLDRFIEATMPANFSSETSTLSNLIRAYHKVSVNGLQIEFLDDRSEQLSHIFTFTPTLSSLYLLTKSGSESHGEISNFKQNDKRKQKMIEFHEDLPHYKRKLLSYSLLE